MIDDFASKATHRPWRVPRRERQDRKVQWSWRTRPQRRNIGTSPPRLPMTQEDAAAIVAHGEGASLNWLTMTSRLKSKKAELGLRTSSKDAISQAAHVIEPINKKPDNELRTKGVLDINAASFEVTALTHAEETQ